MSGAPPFGPQSRVTLANWQDPPFNRWAFQHVRELIPTARIARAADGQAWTLPRAERDVLGFRFRSSGRESTGAKLREETYPDGLPVLHQGRILAEHYVTDLDTDISRCGT